MSNFPLLSFQGIGVLFLGFLLLVFVWTWLHDRRQAAKARAASARSSGGGCIRWAVFAVLLFQAGAAVINMPSVLSFANTQFAHLYSKAAPSLNISALNTSLAPESIERSPTVNAAFIDHVLVAAGSPAQGIGTVMYQLGMQYHIDPAIPLAFFHHESTYGLYGMATITHSIGNIKCSAGYTCYQEYRSYASWAESVADWYRLIHDTYLSQGLNTVAKIIPVYAPHKDNNNEAAYIQAVLDDLVRWRNGQV